MPRVRHLRQGQYDLLYVMLDRRFTSQAKFYQLCCAQALTFEFDHIVNLDYNSVTEPDGSLTLKSLMLQGNPIRGIVRLMCRRPVGDEDGDRTSKLDHPPEAAIEEYFKKPCCFSHWSDSHGIWTFDVDHAPLERN